MRNEYLLALLIAGAGASAVYAEVPPVASDAVAAIHTDGAAMIEAVWPVAVAIVVGLVIMRLFKRVMRAAFLGQ